MKAIFSSEIVDAQKQKMIMSGGDFGRFESNPVLLFVHNDEAVPVGVVKNLRVENKQLIGEILWDEKDPEAMEIKRKYDDGFMRGFSIRATVKKFHKEMVGEIEIVVIDEWELIEISCVSIPANRDALVIEKSVSSVNEAGETVESPESVIATFFSNYQNTNKQMKEVFKKLGIVAVEQQTESEVMKKIGDLETRATVAESDVQKKDGEISTLKGQIDTIQKQAKTKEITDLVDGAVIAKKITAGEAESFKKLAETSFDVVKSLLDAKQGVVPATEQITTASASNATLKTFNENKDKGYMWFMKEKPQVLKDLQKSFPAQFAELQATLQG